MATFLDATLLSNFQGLFTWLITFVIIFGMLELVKPFGEGKGGVNALIAVAAAFLVLFTKPARGIVQFIVPWMTVLAIGVFLIILVFMMFGVKADTIRSWAMGASQPWIITIAVVIALFALGGAFSGTAGEAQQAGPQPELNQTSGSGLSGGEYVQNQQVQQNQPEGRQVESENFFASNLIFVFTHPKVLGTVFLLVLGTVTIIFLSQSK